MIKRIFLFALFAIWSVGVALASDDKQQASGSDASMPQSAETTENVAPTPDCSSGLAESKNSGKVYICLGPYAYAYHLDSKCKRLHNCTCSIVYVTREEAKKRDRIKPCGHCAKGQPILK